MCSQNTKIMAKYLRNRDFGESQTSQCYKNFWEETIVMQIMLTSDYTTNIYCCITNLNEF